MRRAGKNYADFGVVDAVRASGRDNRRVSARTRILPSVSAVTTCRRQLTDCVGPKRVVQRDANQAIELQREVHDLPFCEP